MSTLMPLQKAYLLHARSYRDSSVIGDFMTEESGRVHLVCRGVRREKSRSRGLLQPFVPLLITWFGKSELATMRQVEPNGQPHLLSGDRLVCGLYVNELLVRLLHRADPHPKLYAYYHETITDLLTINNTQITLRRFERRLLAELGYALQLEHETATGVAIDPAKLYYFGLDFGIAELQQSSTSMSRVNIFSGEHLLQIAAEEFETPMVLREAKRLMRLALQAQLGGKPLKSRELWT